MEASERAAIIASESNNVVRFVFSENNLFIKANAPTMGDFSEEIEITRVTGNEEVKIAFNVRLVLDVIKVLDGDDIKMEFNNGLSPCIIQQVLDDDYNYIIMPIRTSEFQQVDKNEQEEAKVEVEV